MEANELRCNNLVLYKGEVYEVEWISYEDPFNPKDYSPIIITREWLLRLGFTYRKPSGLQGQDQWAGLGFISNGKINFRGHPGSMMLEGYFNTHIETVHQLQNLYFALTGTELECAQ